MLGSLRDDTVCAELGVEVAFVRRKHNHTVCHFERI